MSRFIVTEHASYGQQRREEEWVLKEDLGMGLEFRQTLFFAQMADRPFIK
ncbi:hypothetical protein [Cutibacterium sp. V947]